MAPRPQDYRVQYLATGRGPTGTAPNGRLLWPRRVSLVVGPPVDLDAWHYISSEGADLLRQLGVTITYGEYGWPLETHEYQLRGFHPPYAPYGLAMLWLVAKIQSVHQVALLTRGTRDLGWLQSVVNRVWPISQRIRHVRDHGAAALLIALSEQLCRECGCT